jgi:hypothetical protein
MSVWITSSMIRFSDLLVGHGPVAMGVGVDLGRVDRDDPDRRQARVGAQLRAAARTAHPTRARGARQSAPASRGPGAAARRSPGRRRLPRRPVRSLARTAPSATSNTATARSPSTAHTPRACARPPDTPRRTATYRSRRPRQSQTTRDGFRAASRGRRARTKRLLTITRQEVLRHARNPLNPPNSSPLCATASRRRSGEPEPSAR